MQDPTFLCEKGAREQALRLAMELHTFSPSATPPLTSRSMPRSRTRPRLHVGFATELELRTGPEDQWKWRGFRIPISLFACGITPWSGCSEVAKMRHQNSSGHLQLNDFRSDFHCLALNPISSGDMFPEYTTCKISDNYHNVPSRTFQGPDPEPDPDVIPDIEHAPAFAQDLRAIADHHEAFTNLDEDGTFYLRTWFINHHSLQVNFHPRTVELQEDWRRWERDILDSWRDHVQGAEAIYFHLVRPDPDRSYMRRPAHADVILTQGNDAPRRAGLTTVHYHGDRVTPHSYAVAISFDLQVSGWEIAGMADALQWCTASGHTCATWHGWTPIPFSQDRVHAMQSGHSFVTTVSMIPAQSSSTPRTFDGSLDFELEGPAALETTSHDEAIQTINPEYEIGVHVYRLHQPDGHCFVSWESYRTILLDIINCLELQRNSITVLHYLRVSPVGIQQDTEESVILQGVHDIPAGSNERLVLVDQEIHYRPLRSGLHVPPSTSRKVMKLLPTLHRSQVLLTLGLHDYCELQTDRCLVHHDNELWSACDPSAHNIEHGAYLRIEVPPPHDDNLDTDVAIAISREFSLAHVSSVTTEDCDRSSMFQTSAHICQFKVAPQDVQSPPLLSMLGSGQQAPRHRHRRVQFAGEDFINFERIFLAHSFIECEEEGHVAYLDTWFIHHRNHPTCRTFRAVRLHEDPAEWIHDIIEPWEDLLQPQEDILLHLVRPPPPCSRFGCTLAHVIIEQSSRPDFVPGLISILDFDDNTGIPSHSAYSMPNLLNHNAVLRMADALFTCRLRPCRVLLGALPFGLYDYELIHRGIGFVIHLQARQPLQSDLSDDSSLMQTQLGTQSFGSQSLHEIDSRAPVDHFIEESPTCHPDSGDIRRQVPPPLHLDGLQAMPAVVQELFMHWLSHATHAQAQQPPAEPSMVITTWYLAMPQHPGCDASRPVLLRQDFQQWLQTIIEAWHDVADVSLPFFVHLVRPQPHIVMLDDQRTIHVLVVQNPPADGVANLFTIVEPNQVLQPLRNMARFAPTPISHSQAIGFAGLADKCYFNTAPMLCSFWHGTFEIRDRIALQNRPGYGFVFHIQEAPQPPTPNFWEEDDDSTLLQYPPLSGRCQTAGQVAHTQRPSADKAPRVVCLSDTIPTPPKVTVDFTTVEQLARELSDAHSHFQQD